METALPSMRHVQWKSATGTRAQPAKSPKETHSTVSSQPESPPKTGVKRNQWLENQGQWSWVSGFTHNALRKTIKSKQWAAQRSLGVNLGTLLLPLSAWVASSGGEAMPEGSPQAGGCSHPPHYLIQWAGTKPHLSSWSCLSLWTDLAQFCPHWVDTATLAFTCKALLRAHSNLSILGSQG